jgi:hypothetical protein
VTAREYAGFVGRSSALPSFPLPSAVRCNSSSATVGRTHGIVICFHHPTPAARFCSIRAALWGLCLLRLSGDFIGLRDRCSASLSLKCTMLISNQLNQIRIIQFHCAFQLYYQTSAMSKELRVLQCAFSSQQNERADD